METFEDRLKARSPGNEKERPEKASKRKTIIAASLATIIVSLIGLFFVGFEGYWHLAFGAAISVASLLTIATSDRQRDTRGVKATEILPVMKEMVESGMKGEASILKHIYREQDFYLSEAQLSICKDAIENHKTLMTEEEAKLELQRP